MVTSTRSSISCITCILSVIWCDASALNSLQHWQSWVRTATEITRAMRNIHSKKVPRGNKAHNDTKENSPGIYSLCPLRGWRGVLLPPVKMVSKRQDVYLVIYKLPGDLWIWRECWMDEIEYEFQSFPIFMCECVCNAQSNYRMCVTGSVSLEAGLWACFARDILSPSAVSESPHPPPRVAGSCFSVRHPDSERTFCVKNWPRSETFLLSH